MILSTDNVIAIIVSTSGLVAWIDKDGFDEAGPKVTNKSPIRFNTWSGLVRSSNLREMTLINTHLCACELGRQHVSFSCISRLNCSTNAHRTE